MLQIGDSLWWISKDGKESDFVIIEDVSDKSICVRHKGKTYQRDLDVIGKKLFVKRPVKDESTGLFSPAPMSEGETCEDCYLKLNEQCGNLKNIRCSDYRPKVSIPKEEREQWPQYGDATAISRRDWGHFR